MIEDAIIKMMENAINIADYGITSGLYIIIILTAMYYIPKLINKHFEVIKEMNEKNNITQEKMLLKYEESLNRISANFEKWVENSVEWHNKHNIHLTTIENKIDRIETTLQSKKI